MTKQQTGPAEDAWPQTAAGGSYEVRRWTSGEGLSLYARDYAGAGGDARVPVICLHGLTRNSKDFEHVAPRIAAQGRRVLVPDVRGRGLSDRDPNPSNYTPRTYARDVLDLMDTLGIARAVFIGTSMGGIVAMAIAGLRLRAIAASVLNDVGPQIAPEGLARITSYAGKQPAVHTWDDTVAYVRVTYAAAFPSYGDDDWLAFAKRTFREGHDGRPELDYDPAIMTPIRQGGGKAPSFIAWYLFRRLARKPALLIRGGLSDLISLEIAQRMSRKVAALRCVEVPGVGHAPALTEPAAVAALEAFLKRTP